MIFDASAAEEKIGYEFKDKMLLRKCFTHSSYSHENKVSAENNEVLEFFGDAILEFLVTEYLCKNELGDEGKLTELRKKFVSKEPLQKVITDNGLDSYMLLGHGEAMNFDRNEKVLSSLFEAIVAGIYYDGGMLPAKKFVYDKLITPLTVPLKTSEIKTVKKTGKPKEKDAKTAFQELANKKKLGRVDYVLLSKKGPDHSPIFTVALSVNGKRIAKATGNSKKQAEKNAAKVAIEKINLTGKKQ